MKLDDEHHRAIIFYNFQHGITQQQCIDELNSVRWYGEFNQGRRALQDEFREVRPKSVVVLETSDIVRKLILQERHMTYCRNKSAIASIPDCINICLKKKLFTFDPIQFVNRLNNVCVDWSREMLITTIAVLRHTSVIL